MSRQGHVAPVAEISSVLSRSVCQREKEHLSQLNHQQVRKPGRGGVQRGPGLPFPPLPSGHSVFSWCCSSSTGRRERLTSSRVLRKLLSLPKQSRVSRDPQSSLKQPLHTWDFPAPMLTVFTVQPREALAAETGGALADAPIKAGMMELAVGLGHLAAFPCGQREAPVSTRRSRGRQGDTPPRASAGLSASPVKPSGHRHWNSYSPVSKHWPPCWQGLRSQGELLAHCETLRLSRKL